MFVRAQVLAKALGIHVRSAYHYAQFGRLPAIRIGGAVRFSVDQVARFLGLDPEELRKAVKEAEASLAEDGAQ